MRAFLLCAAFAPSTVALVLQPALHRGRLPALAKLQPLAEAPRRSLVTCQAAATLGDEDAAPAEGDSSFTSTVFNTCKAALGSGVLALPAGVKMMGDVPAVLWPANALIVGLGAISAYAFSLTARMCVANDAESLGEAWKKAIGERTAWIVPAALAALTVGTCAAYAIILGDSFSSVAVTFGARGVLATRHASILACAAALLPLCLLKSLAALAPSSIIGVFGVVFTGGFLGLRLKQGAYKVGGAFHSAVAPALRPAFGAVGTKPLFPSSLVLISMVATAYMAHFSAPQFYYGLKDRSMAKFNKMTALSFAIIAAVTVAMTTAGFLTFGGATSGLVLNNYATADAGATLARLLMGFAIFGAYPICFAAARDALFELKPAWAKARGKFTQAMHLLITAAGLAISDVGFVVSFVGGVLGSAIIYIFPALLLLATTKEQAGKGKGLSAERLGCRAMAVLGVALAILGGGTSIAAAFL